jgi:hypothetical protein
VSFGKALDVDTTITLAVTAGASAVASIPATITGLAGHTSVTFTLTTAPVGTATTVQISASANSGTKTGSLSVH